LSAAGFSASTTSQISDMLKVVASAVERVHLKAKEELNSRHDRQAQHKPEMSLKAEQQVHDGRLDCVAGNGVMSELGIGIEPADQEIDTHAKVLTANDNYQAQDLGHFQSRITQSEVDALPIVILKNYASKSSRDKEELLDALANWAARLVDQKVQSVQSKVNCTCTHLSPR
jgi:hypothetical protein